MKATLTKDQIFTALSRLNDKLAERGVKAELWMFGGGVMVLAFDARLSTRGVDAVFVPKMEVSAVAGLVADELSLEEDWLNDGVKGFLSPKGEHTMDQMPQFGNLRVLRPSAEYLLALKLMAARSGAFDMAKDYEDALVLCRHLGVDSGEAAAAVVEKFFPASVIQARTIYFIEEVIAEIANSEK